MRNNEDQDNGTTGKRKHRHEPVGKVEAALLRMQKEMAEEIGIPEEQIELRIYLS